MFSNLTIKIIFWCVVILTICGVIPWIVLGAVLIGFLLLLVAGIIYAIWSDD